MTVTTKHGASRFVEESRVDTNYGVSLQVGRNHLGCRVVVITHDFGKLVVSATDLERALAAERRPE